MPKRKSRVSRTAAKPASARPVNSWWPRFWAWLVDIIIIGVVSWVLLVPFGFAPWNMGWHMWSWWGAGMWNSFAYGFLAFIYWSLLDADGRQSVGKKVMNLKLVKAGGGNADITSSAISAFGKAFLLPIDLIIGVLARPGRKQRLFNVASDTVVVRV